MILKKRIFYIIIIIITLQLSSSSFKMIMDIHVLLYCIVPKELYYPFDKQTNKIQE